MELLDTGNPRFKFVTEPPVALPVKLKRADVIPTIKALYEQKLLNKQRRGEGPAQYANPIYGPCAIGAVIPEELGRWIDSGNVVESGCEDHGGPACYIAIQMVEAGVFEFDDTNWFCQIQSEHDSREWKDFEQSLLKTG